MNEQKVNEFLAVELCGWTSPPKPEKVPHEDWASSMMWCDKNGEWMVWKDEWNPLESKTQWQDYLLPAMRERGWDCFISNKCANEGVAWMCVMENPPLTKEWHKMDYPSFRQTAPTIQEAVSMACYRAMGGDG